MFSKSTLVCRKVGHTFTDMDSANPTHKGVGVPVNMHAVIYYMHFVRYPYSFTEFLATLLELLIFLYLFSPEPLILLTFSTFPWEKGEFFNTKR